MAKRDVELIIRARDEATKGLASITRALEAMDAAQGETGNSAIKLSEDLEKLGASGTAGRAFKQITKDVEKVSAVLERQERRLDEAGAEVADYARQIEAARLKIIEFNAAQEHTVPRNKTALKRAAAEYEAVVGAVGKLEAKAKSAQEKLAAQQQEVEETRVSLSGMREQAEEAAVAITRLTEGERKLAEAADQATKKNARLAASLAEVKARKEALARGRDLTNVLGSGDPAAQVRKAKVEFQQAAEKLAKLRKEFRETATPSATLGRAIGEQGVQVEQLWARYQALSSQASQVIADSKRKEAQARAEAAANRQAAEANEQLAAAERQRQAATAQVRQTNASSVISETRTDVNRQIVDQEKLQAAVNDLKLVYSSLDAELRKVQATHGLFGAAQDQLRAKMVTLQGEIRQGERALREYGTVGRTAATSTTKVAVESERAARKMGDAAHQAVRANSELRKVILGTRQSLGLLQRIRGQFLAIGASYIGVFGVANFTAGIAQAQRDMDSIRNRFLVGFADDQAAATAELEFTRKTAKDLGLDFRVLGKEYSKLTAASLETELQGAKTRKIFLAMAQSSRVLNLTSEDTAGAIKAFTDIISKGTVQAEELRGQLGDRFPGAMQIMSKALGIGTEELNKMMEQGQLTRDSLVYFADQMAKRVAGALPQAVTTFDAQLQRLKSAWFETQVAIGESGFLDGIGEGMERLANALQDPEVREAMKEMGKEIGDMVAGFAKIIETEDGFVGLTTSLKNLAVALAGVLALVATGTIVQGLVGLKLAIGGLIPLLVKLLPFLRALALTLAISWGPAIGSAIAGLGALAAAIGGPVLLAIAALAAAVAAPFLYNWAYDNFPQFRKLAIEWGDTIRTLVEMVIMKFKQLGAFLRTAFSSPLKTVKSLFYKEFGEIFKFLGNGFAALGNFADLDWAKNLGKDLLTASKASFAESERQIQDYYDAAARIEEEALAGTIERKKKVGAELLKVQREIDKANRADPRKVRGGAGSGAGRGQATEDEPLPPFKPGASKGSSKKTEAEKLTDKVARDIARLEQRLAELKADDKNLSPAARLDAELKAIASKYKKNFDDLTKLGKGRDTREWQIVEALVEQESLLARQKAAKEEQELLDDKREAHEKRVNDLATLREQIQTRIKFLQDQGDGESLAEADRLKLKLTETDVVLVKAIDDAIKFYQALGGPEADAAIQKLELLKGGVKSVGDKILSAANAGKSFGELAKSSTDKWLDGIRDTGDVLGSAREAYRTFASDFLLQIAKMIAQQALFNALQAGANAVGGGYGAFFTAAAAAIRHDGGLVTSTAGGRTVPAALFANAMRLHGGGIAGLKPNEVPTILEKNEEVLTRDDPRHILNGGGGNSAGAANPPSWKIINAIDSTSVLSEAMSSAQGEKVVFNFFRANKSALKQILG